MKTMTTSENIHSNLVSLASDIKSANQDYLSENIDAFEKNERIQYNITTAEIRIRKALNALGDDILHILKEKRVPEAIQAEIRTTLTVNINS